MTLRFALLTVSIAAVIGSLGAMIAGWHAQSCLIWSVIVMLAILFERWHYSPPARSGGADEVKTGERFIDPETGALMEVFYDEKTGERRYGEVSENRSNG